MAADQAVFSMSEQAITPEQEIDLAGSLSKLKHKSVARAARSVKRRRAGAPTKLTIGTAAKILVLVSEGNYPRVACAAAGITKRTLDNWRERAREFIDDAECDWEDIPPSERIYVEFFLMLQIAEANSEASLLRRAVRGEKGWQAAMTVLERRRPEHWGRQETRIHAGDEERPIVFELGAREGREAKVAGILDQAGVLQGNGREITDDRDIVGELAAGEGIAQDPP